ncbi:MAG: hypothetical protein OXG88_03410 [Gammaproteobacteria bacterium]|nr:hypothetical protein [Gammaproteobacteria bacterium]
MKHVRARWSRGFDPAGGRTGGTLNTITESYDRGWKLLEAKMGEDSAKLEARLGNDIAKLREDSAKRDRNMSIQIYAVAFGIIIVILGIGGTIISLLV